MREPGFRGETPSDCIELAAAQRTDQVTPDRDLISVAAGKPLLCQGIDPPIKRGADFGAETGARKLGRLSGDQAPVEPGRPFRCHLLVEIKVRADRERDALPAPCILKPTQFHNAADRTVAGRFDVGELEVMDAPIDSVDDGERRSPQLIVEAAGNETADDRFAMGFAFERPGRWRARCAVFCEGLMQPLDDIAALPSARKRCSASAARTQRAGPAGSASPSRSSVRIRPIRISRSGSPAASRSGRRSMTPSALPASRASTRSSFVQRSAVTSASRPRRTSSSDRGPSSRVTRSPARARKPVADIIAADDEVRAVVGAAAHKDMDMGMLGVPVVDGDPVEPRAEIARGLVHQLAGKAAQAR